MGFQRALAACLLAIVPACGTSDDDATIDAGGLVDGGAGRSDASGGDGGGDVDAGASADSGARPDGGGECVYADQPTAATVGLPAGTELTVLDSDTHTDHDGQVFDGVDFQARLYVDHQNVVIRNSRLVGDIYYAVYSTNGPLTIEDSEIMGGVLAPDGFTARRNYVHAPPGGDKDDGFIFAASDVLIEDNRIDGLVGGDGAHVDGIQIMAGVNVVIRHNWIDASSPPVSGGGVNAAVFFAPDMGEIRDVTVECNHLIAREAYYPLRIESGGTVIVRHNRWDHDHLGSPYLLSGDTVASVWEDNAYEDGELIPAP